MKKHAYTNNWSKSIDHDNELLLRWLHLPSEEQDEWIELRKLVKNELTNHTSSMKKNQLALYDEIRPKYVNKFKIDEELIEFAISEAISEFSKKR